MGLTNANVDYIIVGQGIAGCTLAFRMMEAGHTIKVIDDPQKNSGSRVAAGVFNFNGMGAKGVSLAAWFSKHLMEHICESAELMALVDMRRFAK